MEQRRVGLAGEDEDEGRGAQAERRTAEGAFEGERVEGLGAGEDRHVGAGAEAAGLEVGEERRVFLRGFGDAEDRRLLAGLDLGQRGAGRAALTRTWAAAWISPPTTRSACRQRAT